MREKAAYLEHENAILDERNSDLEGIHVVEQIAREELGLVDPNTVIVDPES
jgi:cell division protein FtsB